LKQSKLKIKELAFLFWVVADVSFVDFQSGAFEDQ
tara:strand:- start:161 stop:265 length:105 start_codon:yes stop_codon:yes gene_type:complete